MGTDHLQASLQKGDIKTMWLGQNLQPQQHITRQPETGQRLAELRQPAL
jgi:hypothetical protein